MSHPLPPPYTLIKNKTLNQHLNPVVLALDNKHALLARGFDHTAKTFACLSHRSYVHIDIYVLSDQKMK